MTEADETAGRNLSNANNEHANFTEEIPWLTADDKDWIMGRGLCEWLNWKLANEPVVRGKK